jgi:hypothetical protein
MPLHHPDRSHDLETRVDSEIRERLEEAIDFVCLDALVRARHAQQRPSPVADSVADRAEYAAYLDAFLRLLDAEVPPPHPGERGPRGDEQARLVARQVAAARALPDYWQRFETLSLRFLAEPAASGGERRGVLARLFGRG